MPEFETLAPAGTDFTADPYPVYAHLREQGPVHRVPTGEAGDIWVILGHEEVRNALTDVRLSNDVRHSSRWVDDGGHAIGRNMLQTDAPQHTRLRKLVAGEFTARRIESLRPRIQQLTDELLDAIAPLAGADLVESLARPLPIAVICELLGVPATDQEPFRMAFVLLVAGHETTVNLLSNGTYALLTHPEQLTALRADRSLLDGAIEEMLRYEGPVTSSAYRWATEDVEIDGVTIPAGEAVLILLGSASRDPRRFPDPDGFDIRRPRAGTGGVGHLAFGHGIHYCLGAPLARLEATVAFTALLDRFPDLTLATDPAQLPWRPGLIRGLAELPVRYGPRG
jgi:cytochrome P450